MSLTFLGMLLGLLVDVLIAARFGAGRSADALIIALSIPLFVDTVTRESAKSSLVPLFVERYETDEAAYWHFVSALLNGAVALGFGAMLLLLAGAPWIVAGVGPGLSAASQAEATRLLRLCAPMVGAAPVITLLSVALNSQERFSAVALRNAAAPAVVALAFAASWDRPDTLLWVAGGYSVGFVIFAAGLFAWCFYTGAYVLRAWPSRGDTQAVWDVVKWPSLGVGTRQVSRLAERAIASLVTAGGVSAYYFAFRIFSAVQTLVGLSVATTSLPELSKLNVRNDLRTMTRALRRRSGIAMGIGGLAALVPLLFSGSVVAFLYGRAAFGGESVEMTSQILFWLSLGIPVHCAMPVLSAGLYARKAYRSVALNMVAVAILNTALAALFAIWMGLVGIALAVVLASVFALVLLNALLSRENIRLVF
jgi:murein biosynthesis integral membrane protein MurJ